MITPCFVIKAKNQEQYDNLKKRQSKSDPGIRFNDGDKKIEIDYSFRDLQERNSFLLQGLRDLAGHSETEILKKFGNPAYVKEHAALLDEARNALRDFDYKDPVDPGPIENKEVSEAIAEMMDQNGGVCLGTSHNDPKDKELLYDLIDGGTATGSLLFIEELKEHLQKDIEDYLKSPPETPIPDALKSRIKALDDTHKFPPPKNWEGILAKAKERGVKIYAIDSGDAMPEAGSGSAVHHEQRCVKMNYVAQQIMEKAKKENPGAKFIANLGGAHSNTHEGGVPGLAQLLNVPAVKRGPNGKLQNDPEDASKRQMPSEAEQKFMDAFILETEANMKKATAEGVDAENFHGDELYRKAVSLADQLKKAGRLRSPKDVSGLLKNKAVKEYESNLIEVQRRRKQMRKDMNDAITEGDMVLLETVMKHATETDPGLFESEQAMTGTTLLHEAAKQGNTEAIALMSYVNRYDPNVTNKDGETPLHVAAKNKQDKAAASLLAAGANVNAKDKEGQTPAHVAAEISELAIVQQFSDAGADLSIKDEKGRNPIETAFLSRYKDAVRDKLLTDPNYTAIDFNIRRDDVDILAEGALERSRDWEELNSLDDVNKLITNDEDIAKESAEIIVKIERAKRAKRLTEAIQNNDTDSARIELDADPELINTADDGGKTLLHKACYYGFSEVVNLLVGRGADLSLQDKDGNTALHAACLRRPDGPSFNDSAEKQREDRDKEEAEKKAQAAIVQKLLESGADPNIRDKTKKTPLHVAAFNGNADSTRNLLLRGADVNMKDERGWTPRDVAMVSTKVEAEQVFYDFGLVDNDPLLPKSGAATTTIDILCNATICEDPADKEKLREAFTKLYANEMLRPILELAAKDAANPRTPPDGGVRFAVANSDSNGHLYMPPGKGIGSDGAYEEDANIVMVSGKTAKDLTGVLIHEMTHLATRIVYGQDVVPFAKGSEEETAFINAIEGDAQQMHMLSDSSPLEHDVRDRINGRLDGYTAKYAREAEKKLLQEFLVGVPQLIAGHGTEAVQKLSPNLTRFFKDFGKKCETTANNDPRFVKARAQIDDTPVLDELNRNPPALPHDKDAWLGKDDSELDAKKLMEKIRQEYAVQYGVPELPPGVNFIYNSRQFKIPDDQKDEFEQKMKTAEEALTKALKSNKLPKELSADDMRLLVAETTKVCHDKDDVNMEKIISRRVDNWVRDAKVKYVEHCIDDGKPITDVELAEAIVIRAENEAIQPGTKDDVALYDQVVEVNRKKHEATVASLAKTLSNPKYNAQKGNPSKLIKELSTAMAGSKQEGVYQKETAKGTGEVSIEKSKAKRTWLQQLKTM